MRLGVTSGSMLTAAFDAPLSDGGDAVTSARIEWDVDPDFESAARMPLKGSVIVAWPAAAFAQDAAASAGGAGPPPAGTAYYTVANLATASPVYVRASACNRVGCGAPSYAVPAGASPRRQVAGVPFDVAVAPAAQPGACRSISVRWLPPVVPAHGLWCASAGPGPGAGNGTGGGPGACPAGMGFGTQADGGAAVASYELAYSAYADFSQAGSVSVPVVAGTQGAPLDVTLGPGLGATLQPGVVYFIRVAARNAQGAGAFCANDGPTCGGAPLASVSSPDC